MPTSTLFPPLGFTNQPLHDDLDIIRSATSTSPVTSNGSSECESEHLLGLFGCPDGSSEFDSKQLLSLFGSSESNFSMNDKSGRDGRPFPYTRSKTRWRKRPTNELKYLRSQIAELEGLLGNMNPSGSQSKMLTNGEEVRDGQVQVLQKLRKESHGKKVEAALAENRKLKAMVSSQFHVAKALQAALDESMRLRARKVCWPSSAAASDELVFALLDEEKEIQYAATDKVLDEGGISRIYHPYVSELVFQNGKNGVAFQHNDVRIIPFAVADVVRALRRSLRHGGRVGPSQHCRKFLMHDSFSQAVTVDNLDVPGTSQAEVKSRHLLWSVVKPDRTIITWSSFNEYQGRSRVRLLKRLWLSVEPIKLQTSSGTIQGSILRTIVRFTPVDPQVDLQHIAEMSDVIMCGYKRDSIRVVLAVRDQLAASVAKG